jgi:hypothetical protein
MARRDKHHCDGGRCNRMDLSAKERGNPDDEPQECCECPCSGCSFSIGFARGHRKGLEESRDVH